MRHTYIQDPYALSIVYVPKLISEGSLGLSIKFTPTKAIWYMYVYTCISYGAWADQRFRRYYIMHIIPHCRYDIYRT